MKSIKKPSAGEGPATAGFAAPGAKPSLSGKAVRGIGWVYFIITILPVALKLPAVRR